ncbi:cyclohexanecarboxylate-CoA ligase [Thermocatellispora tengchongensis]|uniref:Cyclohexanecarboxylate-CoA ligase n=1 Tax=Thermocatellispora tengchongensis TaxID=1073253 RepID=A0A840PJ57_9ACTN|nr:AMP-binding protein [Thermocatellispora tengchongensis]MBB5136105.1 cyclohexanecarboxylate-CoA ligase [Thermocatellispora tengchongensis]
MAPVLDTIGGRFKAEGFWRDRTAVDDLRDAVARFPGRTAVVCWHADGREPDRLTYAELAERTERLAAALYGLGVRRGDVVSIQLPNSWQLVALCLACARVGAVAGPIATIMRRREVEFMTRLTRSPLYIGPVELRGHSFADMSAEVARAVPTLRRRVLLGAAGTTAGADADVLDLDRDLLGRAWEQEVPAGALDACEARPGDLAQVMFTSGTTGEPKGVMHSHNTLGAINRAQIEALRLTSDEVTAMGSPTTLQAGYTWNFLMPLMLGATAVQIDSWDPGLMLRVMERERVTFFYGPPPFLMDLIRAQQEDPKDLSALAAFATGSAPVPPVLVEQARDVLGCRVYALWGMTENGAVTITRPEDPPMRAAESDGTPVAGMEVRIVDEETGLPVAPGATGLLQVRGAGQCLGYFRREELYAESLTADGWFDTGDLARDDGHGGIRIAGRVKDVISRGGVKIPVVEVEAALLRHPAIRDIAVVGLPDDRLGERACAVIVPEGTPPTLEDLRTHLAELDMAKQYWPERMEVVDALPRTPSGKVQKFVLRDRLGGE